MGWWPELVLSGVLPVCWEAFFAVLRLAGTQPAVLMLRMSWRGTSAASAAVSLLMCTGPEHGPFTLCFFAPAADGPRQVL